MFAIGSAGAGKTLLAVQAALRALQEGSVKKLILTRPKVSYADHTTENKQAALMQLMRPELDAMDKLCAAARPPLHSACALSSTCSVSLVGRLGDDAWKQLEQKGVLQLVGMGDEIGGLTFEDSFVIADEMQNATQGKIKRLMERQGEGTKMVLIGDPGQEAERANYVAGASGLEKWAEELGSEDGYVVVRFTSDDVQRSKVAAAVGRAAEKMAQDDQAKRPPQRRGGGASIAADALQSVRESVTASTSAAAGQFALALAASASRASHRPNQQGRPRAAPSSPRRSCGSAADQSRGRQRR